MGIDLLYNILFFASLDFHRVKMFSCLADYNRNGYYMSLNHKNIYKVQGMYNNKVTAEGMYENHVLMEFLILK